MYAVSLRCVRCGFELPLEAFYRCPDCGGILDVKYDYGSIERDIDPDEFLSRGGGVWVYWELLPLADRSNIISLGEGGTPLQRSTRLSKRLGLRELYLKNETVNPSGSFKDRPMSVAISKALEFGFKRIILASSGNAAASASAYAAKAGLECVIYVPDGTPREKVLQAVIHGAEVKVVKGTYSEAFESALIDSERFGWFNVTSTYLNPYTLEGDKTIAYELYRDLGGRVPRWVIVPVGAGPLLAGVWKGFWELMSLGLVNEIPSMVGVQADGCSPIVRAFVEGRNEVEAWVNPKTIASAIADPLKGYTQDGTRTVNIIRESGGFAVSCSDNEIIDAVKALARYEGLFAEFSAAASIAALSKGLEEGLIERDDLTVCLITGHGLKTVEMAAELLKG